MYQNPADLYDAIDRSEKDYGVAIVGESGVFFCKMPLRVSFEIAAEQARAMMRYLEEGYTAVPYTMLDLASDALPF